MNYLKEINEATTIETWDEGSNLISVGGCIVKYVNDTISILVEMESKHYWRRPTIPLMSSPISGVKIPDSFSAGLTAYVHDDLKKNHINQIAAGRGVLLFDLTRDIFGDFFKSEKSAFANPYTILGLEKDGVGINLPEASDMEYFSQQGFIASSSKDANFFPLWHASFTKFVEKFKGNYRLVMLENFLTDRAVGVDGEYFFIDRAYVSNANKILEKLFNSAKKFAEVEVITVPQSMLVSGTDVIYGGPNATHYAYQTLDWITKEFAGKFLKCNDVVEDWYQSRLMNYAEQFHRKHDGLTAALVDKEITEVEHYKFLESLQAQAAQISVLEARCETLLEDKEALNTRAESHAVHALARESRLHDVAAEKNVLHREYLKQEEKISTQACLNLELQETISMLTANNTALEIKVTQLNDKAELFSKYEIEKSFAEHKTISTREIDLLKAEKIIYINQIELLKKNLDQTVLNHEKLRLSFGWIFIKLIQKIRKRMKITTI